MPIKRTQYQPERVRALFLFAHQDDEFGVYGHIAREIDRGARVQCVYLTDGGWGNQDVRVRNAESLAVLADLGVASESVAFVGQAESIADGTLHRRLDAAWRGLDALVGKKKYDRLYMPAWEGGHQDHDAAHLIGLRIACSYGLMSAARQYPLYNGIGLPGPLFRVLHPLVANGTVENLQLGIMERLRYASWLLRYRSQWKSVLGLFLPTMLRLVFSGTYQTQPVSLDRAISPPHDGPLLYERRTGLSYGEFRAATASFLEVTVAARQSFETSLPTGRSMAPSNAEPHLTPQATLPSTVPSGNQGH